MSSGYVAQSPSSRSVADNVFVERIKSRVGHWISACKRSRTKTSDGEQNLYRFILTLLTFFLHLIYFFSSADALVSSLRKLILGGEDYGSRPSLNIDVCSERQVQLVFEVNSC